MNSSTGDKRQKACHWLGVAEKLLEVRDIEGCKQFVEQAVSMDPLVPGAEEIVAAAEVLKSAKLRRINGHPDYYSILGLDSSIPESLDHAAVSLHYHRLSLLLHRDVSTPAFSDAARLVEDSWSVLSDPPSKAVFDHELELELAKLKAQTLASKNESPPKPKSKPLKNQPSPKSKPSKTQSSPKSKPSKTKPLKTGSLPKGSKKASDFWTMCTTCCHVHLYGRLCEGQYLLCHSCNRPFFASAMAEPPPIVPDSDMYYCSWGFFPLGFPGGPGFGGMMGPNPIGVPPVPDGQTGGKSDTPISEPVRKGRGRPKKNSIPVVGTTPSPGKVSIPVVGISPGSGKAIVPVVGTPSSESVRRGRGRPKKNTTGTQLSPVPAPVSASVPVMQETGTSSEQVRRGRGRPRKSESGLAKSSKEMVDEKRVNAKRKKVMIDIN